MPRKTLQKVVSIKGLGLHAGSESFIEFRPASVDSGICFINDNGTKIRAVVLNVSKTARGTFLDNISTVEHVMSAIYGLGVDDIEIFVKGGEPPALDGSCIIFVELLKSAGFVEMQGEKKIIKISSNIFVGDNNSFIKASPLDHFSVSSYINYPDCFVGEQNAVFDEISDDFGSCIAPARTFGLVSELEELKSSGLAKGASINNAIGILDNCYTTKLRFPNELARHKILDIMGDVALCGSKVIGKIESHKAGHKLNIELSRRLLNEQC